MNRCDEIQGRLDDWLDDLLEPAEQGRVAAHLQDCADCRRLFEQHNEISEDLQTLGQLVDRMTATPREVAQPRRRWQRIGRVAAAVLIVGTIGMGAVWYRSIRTTELTVRVPDAPRQDGNLDDGRMAPRVRTERSEALIHLVKGDDRLAVRLPSKNPRVQIVWFYDPARPKVESPEHEDEGVIPSS